MITEARIQNFKSVHDLTLKLGRVSVFIGENGSGKSNILEALAFAAADAQDKLDNEFLVSRGIRVTEPQFMRSAFLSGSDQQIHIQLTGLAGSFDFDIEYDMRRARWRDVMGISVRDFFQGSLLTQFVTQVAQHKKDGDLDGKINTSVDKFFQQVAVLDGLRPSLAPFIIYSPENTFLRTFEREGQIQPLGVKGEGLFKLLKVLSSTEHAACWEDLKDNLRLLDWFEDLRISANLAPFESTVQIRDRYLSEELAYFDQRSSNEGFLFLLFYFALLVSGDTPAFFAVDNIDASLNPKLCSELLRRFTALAKKYDKQVILTTHNPAILDGLNLNEDEQRLFVVHRNSQGHTKARRITAPKPVGDEPPIKLSEAFLRGILGGLPQNF